MSTDLSIRDFEVRAGGVPVLDIPSLEIESGEVLALLGPNGAGKSTLIHALALLAKPSRGALTFKGETVTRGSDLTMLRRRMGVVFQKPFLMDTTVRRNVASGLAFRKATDIEARVDRALGLFGIPHLADRSARTLSGGEAARVSLARAFVLEPEVMMLDEPFSSLDPPTRHSLLDEVEEILHATRVTTVMATHDASEALRMADRIAVMREGSLVQIGPASEIMHRPASRFVASFVGVETILEGTVTAREGHHVVVSISGTPIRARADARPGDEVVLCIRPERVTLSPSRPDADNVIPGTITSIRPMGHYTKVRVDCGFTVHASVIRADDLSEGMKVFVSMDADSINEIAG
ncbi:MAG: ABC transporter ATP-binding protein [Deltaproteobacteria bacterium]|nr:ABC transporter ATP-binding protein [Deltaproteobacteria bacterium]